VTNTGIFVCYIIFPGTSTKLTKARRRKVNWVLSLCGWCLTRQRPGWVQPCRMAGACLPPAVAPPSGIQPGLHRSKDTGPNI